MLKFWLKSPLFEAAGDGAGSGGGDGAGAGNSGAATFDPIAFKTEFKSELLGEIRKDLNGIAKGFNKDLARALEGLRPSAASGNGSGAGDGAGSGNTGDGNGSGAGSGGDPKLNALQLELKREREQNAARLKALEEKYTAAETEKQAMARDKALTDSLGKFEFLTPEARNTALEIFRGKIQRTDEGEFVAGDLPLDKFIESELPGKHAYLLKAKDVSGAGARSSRGGGSSKYADLDTILRPENFSKLSTAEQAEVRQIIRQASGF